MDAVSKYLADHRFAELFRDELGWDRSSGTMVIDLDQQRLAFESVAQKRGFQILRCSADRQVLMNKGLLRRAQKQIARAIHEHILIYSCDEPPKQVWQWAVRLPDGRRLRHREHPFFSCSPPPPFVTRVSELRFSLDEESEVTLVDALDRVRAALDVSAELNLFAKRPWYAEQSDDLAVAMVNGSSDAFDKFILLHRPLARHFSKPLQKLYGMDADDAEQIGVIGLIEAAYRFDPERGFQFSTYATYWVRQACQRLGPDAALFIRLPAHIVQSFFSFRRHLAKVAAEFGPGAVHDALSARCCAEGNFFLKWLAFERALSVRSLSDRREPEYWQARRLCPPAIEPFDHGVREELAAAVRAAIDRLGARDRRLVRMRFGFDDAPQTLEQIGRAERITRERVRQILNRALDRLRNRLAPGLER